MYLARTISTVQRDQVALSAVLPRALGDARIHYFVFVLSDSQQQGPIQQYHFRPFDHLSIDNEDVKYSVFALGVAWS